MAYKNLQHFIRTLEEAGELVRIKSFVNPHLEIKEIADHVSKVPACVDSLSRIWNHSSILVLLGILWVKSYNGILTKIQSDKP